MDSSSGSPHLCRNIWNYCVDRISQWGSFWGIPNKWSIPVRIWGLPNFSVFLLSWANYCIFGPLLTKENERKGGLVLLLFVWIFFTFKKCRIAAHLEALEFDVSLVATEWFLCLFSKSLPSEVRNWLSHCHSFLLPLILDYGSLSPCSQAPDNWGNSPILICFLQAPLWSHEWERRLIEEDRSSYVNQKISFCICTFKARSLLMIHIHFFEYEEPNIGLLFLRSLGIKWF